MRRHFGFVVACFAAVLGAAACSAGDRSGSSLTSAPPRKNPPTSMSGSGKGGSSLGSGTGGSGAGMGVGSGSGTGSATGSGTGSATGSGSGSATGSDAGADSGSGPDNDSGSFDAGGGDDASESYDAVGSANVQWDQPCLYNFGSSCPFPIAQECGNHQGISVTFPNGPQLLNATLFSGLDCSPNALNDNLNDRQTTMGTGIWMFTDDADVAGVSPANPTSAIWWVGPLTASGYPPPGAPTTGCINYTSAMAMCQ